MDQLGRSQENPTEHRIRSSFFTWVSNSLPSILIWSRVQCAVYELFEAELELFV